MDSSTGARSSSAPRGFPSAFPWVVLGALLALVWAVYSPAIRFELLSWDDDINLQNNPHLTGISLESLRWMFTDLAYQQRYQPLAWLTWSVIFELQGLDPFGYHLINVVLHVLNTALVFCLARRLFQGRWWWALVAAAFWSLHPMRVETVVWAVELLYCQALFFFLLSLLAYLKSHEAGSHPRMTTRWRWASLLAFAFSLFTFPLAFGFVAVLVMLDIYFLKRLPESPREWKGDGARQVWLEKLPFVGVTLLALWLNVVCRINATAIFATPVSLEEFGVFPRVMQAFYTWAYYLWRPLWPVDLTTIPTALIRFDPLGPVFVLSLALIVVGTWLAFRWRTRWPALWCVWVIHLCLLVPMLGLSEHPHMTSDRYSLFISVGWAVLFAMIWGQWRERIPWKGVPEVLVLVLVVSLTVLSVRQVPFWANSFSFFNHLLVQLGDHPFRFNILWRLGAEYQSAGNWEKAEEHFNRALMVQPRDIGRRLWLAEEQTKQGHLDQAVRNYQVVLALEPNAPGIHFRIGQLLMADGQNAAAAAQFAAELKVSPPSFSLHLPLFLATARAGQLGEAQELYRLLLSRYQVSETHQLLCLLAIADGHAFRRNYPKAIAVAGPLPAKATLLGMTEFAEDASRRLKRWEEEQKKIQPPN